MDKLYTFLIGIALGLCTAFGSFSKFWLGFVAGIPVGAVIFIIVVGTIAAAYGEVHDHD